MTKKQALNYLKSSGFSKEQIQAVVEALSSSEMPNKEIINNDLGVDAISRADARSLICNIDIKYHISGISRKAFKDLYNGMDELPSVTPIRPKGHWLDTGWIHECSCCHERSFPFEPAGGSSAYTNFCPNCGADMRTSED